MGTKSKGKRRDVNFSEAIKMLSDMQDQKHLEYTKHFTQNLSTMKVRMEALEDILLEKLGETNESIEERVLVRVEKMQGFVEVQTDVVKGSVLRVKVKEEIVGNESLDNPLQNAFMCVGHNQINANIDVLLVGAKKGETREVVLDDPKMANVKRRITVTVLKIFKGEEVTNETKTEETPVQEQAAAQS